MELSKSALNIALPLDSFLSGSLMYSKEGAAEPLFFGVLKHSSNARNQEYSHADIPLWWICYQENTMEMDNNIHFDCFFKLKEKFLSSLAASAVHFLCLWYG